MVPLDTCPVFLRWVHVGLVVPFRGLRGCLFLQSETCSVEIPELEFELGMGALGGKFTTLEGLLKDIGELVSGPVLWPGGAQTPLHEYLAWLWGWVSHSWLSEGQSALPG